MNLELLVPAWFVLPWLVVAVKIARVSVYESRIGLFANLSPFRIGELLHKIEERRALDPAYDAMRRSTKRWAIITAVWWVTSFIAMVGGAAFYATYIH